MKRWLIGGGVVVFVGVAIFAILVYRGHAVNPGGRMDRTTQSSASSNTALIAGQQLSGGKCTGTGPGQLTHSAMDPNDFAMMIPYGLMVGGHVTPIDHMYYSPTSYQSARDSYPVYAMGDATLVDMEHRTEQPQDNQHTRETVTNEWRLVFSQSCTFYYYYDLLTSVTPPIEAAFNAAAHGQMNASVRVPVKAGELVGHIGGQTLDFAVWNTEKPLSGFVIPEHYQAEAWKPYVADPLPYESADLKQLMLSKYPRTSDPLSGKLDWDVDGTLRGNWFEQGTNYLEGDRNNPKGQWAGHLAFAPDLYDESRWIVSMGDYPVAQDANTQVSATQFYAKASSSAPETITPSSGVVKIELVNENYIKPNGSQWRVEDGLVKNALVGTEGEATVRATALVQLTDRRTLKFEVFPGKAASQVSEFDTAVKTYTR